MQLACTIQPHSPQLIVTITRGKGRIGKERKQSKLHKEDASMKMKERRNAIGPQSLCRRNEINKHISSICRDSKPGSRARSLIAIPAPGKWNKGVTCVSHFPTESAYRSMKHVSITLPYVVTHVSCCKLLTVVTISDNRITSIWHLKTK
jgi:hypothetical protein